MEKTITTTKTPFRDQTAIPELKPPIWESVTQCYQDMEELDKQANPNSVMEKYVGKILEFAGGSTDKIGDIFKAATDLDNAVAQLADKFRPPSFDFNKGSVESYEGFITTAKDKIQDKAFERIERKIKEASERGDKWSAVNNAIVKVAKYTVTTILPILVKGTAVAGLIGASVSTLVGAPLFVLGVIITYGYEEKRLQQMQTNASLAVGLMGNLEKCRNNAQRHLEKRKYFANGKGGSEPYEDSVRFLYKKKEVLGSDVFFIMATLDHIYSGTKMFTKDDTDKQTQYAFRDTPNGVPRDEAKFGQLYIELGRINEQKWTNNFENVTNIKLEKEERELVEKLLGITSEESFREGNKNVPKTVPITSKNKF